MPGLRDLEHDRRPELSELRDRAKSVTMDEVCERLGIRVPHGRKIRSIYGTHDKTPSLHVYQYDWFDYSTGQGGDQIRFVMDHQGWPFAQAVRWLSGSADELARPRQQLPDPDHDVTATWLAAERRADYSGPRWSAAEGYARGKWGLSLHDIVRCDTLVMPCVNLSSPGGFELWSAHGDPKDRGLVRGIKIRHSNGTKTSVPGSSFRYGLYVPRRHVGGQHYAWLVEGESDAWAMSARLDETKWRVFGLPSGAGLWRDEWRKQLTHFSRVFLTFDRDEAGVAATSRVRGSLVSGGISVTCVDAPMGRVAESLMDDWEPTWEAEV